MLYHLLYPLHAHAGLHWLQRAPLLVDAHPRGDAHRAADLVPPRARGSSSGCSAKQIGEQIRTTARRRTRRRRARRRWAARSSCSRSSISTLLWCDLRNRFVWLDAARHRRLRRDRLRRRLPQARRAEQEGHPRQAASCSAQFVIAAVADGVSVLLRSRTTPRCSCASRCRSSTSTSTRSRCWPLASTSRSARSSSSARRTRSTSPTGSTASRSARRSSTPARSCILAYVAGHDAASRASTSPSTCTSRYIHGVGRAGGVLRRAGRRRHRLPLVQHLPGAGVHGRRRLAALGGAIGMLAVLTKNELTLRRSSAACSWSRR